MELNVSDIGYIMQEMGAQYYPSKSFSTYMYTLLLNKCTLISFSSTGDSGSLTLLRSTMKMTQDKMTRGWTKGLQKIRMVFMCKTSGENGSDWSSSPISPLVGYKAS